MYYLTLQLCIKNIAENCGWYSRAYEYSQDYDLSLKLIKKNEFYLIKKFN